MPWCESKQVVHQLQRGIAEDLKTLQEPANGVQICTEDFNPVVSMSDHEVGSCFDKRLAGFEGC